MKFYLIAGEASGDLLGSNLMKAIKTLQPNAEFRLWGGDNMQKEGGVLVKHFKEMAFMGFWEVITHLPEIIKNIKHCKQDILNYNPDALIFIDFPGFNLRIAKWSKTMGFTNYYYVSPQIWAWKENRIKDIKQSLDKLFVILPFEKDYYETKHQYPVSYNGHPLVEIIENELKTENTFFEKEHLDESIPIIALLPGSRKQEIKKMLPVFIEIIEYYPAFNFVIAVAPGIDMSWYKQFDLPKNVKLVSNKTYSILRNATAALVTSGTATLETALFKVPQIVCYKSGFLNYQIGKMILNLPYISLVNIIMDKEVVKELIQHKCNVQLIREELNNLLHSQRRIQVLTDYNELEIKLNKKKVNERIATELIETLSRKKSKS